MPILLNDTASHCSYCDSFPLLKSSKTIDHFLPKSEYPGQAYDWTNLYLSCRECQANKDVHVSEYLLRPDDENYDFSDFFIIDFTEFKLLANPMSTNETQLKAQTTINILNLNSSEFITARRHSYSREKEVGFNKEDFAFRYLFYD